MYLKLVEKCICNMLVLCGTLLLFLSKCNSVDSALHWCIIIARVCVCEVSLNFVTVIYEYC